MSKVADFYVRAMKDEQHRQKLAAIIGEKNPSAWTEEQWKQLGGLAGEMGFSISLQEARDYLASEEAILSDEAVDAVAGGMKANAECQGENAGTRRTQGPPPKPPQNPIWRG